MICITARMVYSRLAGKALCRPGGAGSREGSRMELTVKIDDPKIYTEPWLARDKLRLSLLPDKTEIMEMICAASEAEEYKKTMANPLSK